MAGRVVLDAVQVNESVPDTNWHIVAVSDLDRDGAPDLIWQNVSTGQSGSLDAGRCTRAVWIEFSILLPFPIKGWKMMGPR